MSTRKPAIIYSRTASVKQQPEAQQHQCMLFAEENGYDVEKTFCDEGVSDSTTERAGFQDMLTFIHSQPKNYTVLVTHISRIARNPAICLHIQQALEEAGAEIVDISANMPLYANILKFRHARQMLEESASQI